MNNRAAYGTMRETPLSLLLYDLWNFKKSGKLSLKKPDGEKSVFLEEGNIAITPEVFDERQFFLTLRDKDIIQTSSLENIYSAAKRDQLTLIKACIQTEALSAPQLWTQMQRNALLGIIPFFDCDDSEYLFQPDSKPDKHKIWCRIQTLELILQGTRQMKNAEFIASQLSGKRGLVQSLYPRHQARIPFMPHEEYLLHLFSELQNIEAVTQHSEMSTQDTQRVIFTFLSLGLFSFSQGKGTSLPDFSHTELNTILTTFNRKWLTIYKYISKELGPVAQNILEKSLEDAKTRLSPLFQSVKLQPDGTLDTQSVLKAKFNFSSQVTKQTLLTGLNEIIVSEVLAVKKTLGNEHEAILVNILKKNEI